MADETDPKKGIRLGMKDAPAKIAAPAPKIEAKAAPIPESWEDDVREPEPEVEEVRLHPILTNEEFLAAQGKARVKIEADRKKAAMKSVQEQEEERLRMEEGLYTGGPGDEIVTITLDLAQYQSYLGVNFMRYYHGQTYTVPRHVADSLRESMYRGWRHQDEVDGKSLTQFYQRARATNVSPKGITNAPQRTA